MALHGLGDYMGDDSSASHSALLDSDVVYVDACDGSGDRVLVTSIPRTLEDLAIDPNGRPDLWIRAVSEALLGCRVSWSDLMSRPAIVEMLIECGCETPQAIHAWVQ